MRKRILVLCPRFPYPVIGGDRLRIYQLCRELSKAFDVSLLSLCETRDEIQYPLPDDGVFSLVERVYLPKWRSYLNCAAALPSRRPLQVAYYSCKGFERKLLELLPKHDLALAHLIRTGDYLKGVSAPKVLEMTDAISLNYERVMRVAKTAGFKQRVYSLEHKRLKRYEQSIINNFDLSVLVSEVDRDYLISDDSTKKSRVLVCSNGVDLRGFPFKEYRNSEEIVFIGNMLSVQNLDATIWFARQVMPLLLQRGNFTFKVVGRIGEEQARMLRRLPGVEVTGAVESIPDATTGAFLGVCPMRLGAGVQNKILEYMALGLPVLTTTMGYEGLSAVEGRDLEIADTAEEMTDRIVALHANQSRRLQLAIAAREYVLKQHEWSAMLSPLIERIQRLSEDHATL